MRLASGLALIAVRRSAGGRSGVWAVYARAHSPLCFAASTAARPIGLISPAAISRSAISLFTFDHLLFARRGVKRCLYRSSSMLRMIPSIQPKRSATSTACAHAIDSRPEPFFQ